MSDEKQPDACPLAVCWECGRAVDRWSDSPFGPHCRGCTADEPADDDATPLAPDHEIGGEGG